MEDQQHTEVLYHSNSLPHLLLQVNTDRIHSGLWWILWMLHFQSNRSISFFLFSALLHLQFCNHNIHDINIHITTLYAYARMRTHTHTHTCTNSCSNTLTHSHSQNNNKLCTQCSENLNVLDFVLHIVIMFHIHNVLYLNVS